MLLLCSCTSQAPFLLLREERQWWSLDCYPLQPWMVAWEETAGHWCTAVTKPSSNGRSERSRRFTIIESSGSVLIGKDETSSTRKDWSQQFYLCCAVPAQAHRSFLPREKKREGWSLGDPVQPLLECSVGENVISIDCAVFNSFFAETKAASFTIIKSRLCIDRKGWNPV